MPEAGNFQRFSIDLGIDLGTTNSVVAVCLEGSAQVLRNSQNNELTPSAVRMRPNGALDVGQQAYQRLAINPDEVAIEFKRWIGSDHTVRFPNGREMSPVQLSAEVLKNLLQTAELRLGTRPIAAVITVPAAFDLNQCARTEAAAREAGLRHIALLQEPIAASLAYGFSEELQGGTWLVFDLGGGTLDVALVGVRDGRIEVFDHEGDNFLGGKDLDWLLTEHVLVPRIAERFRIDSWRRDNPERRLELSLLKHLAEDAKIRLSSAEEATVTVESGHVSLVDDDGEEVSLDIVVRRSELESLCSDWLSRAVEVCRRVIDRNQAQRPTRVLLIGGPTNMPIVRRRVAEATGLEVVTGANPMTAVAEGAALFAANQPLPPDLRARAAAAPAASRERQVVVSHVNVTDDEEVPVGIKVSGGDAAEVEVVASDGSWRSGRLRLSGEGATVVPVALMRQGRNEFRVEVFASDGSRVPVTGDTFTIARGLVAAPPPLSRSIGVVAQDAGFFRHVVEWLLPKGTPLPARASYEFRTTIALVPGGDIEVISVHLVEGESRRPERNRPIGRIDITDRDIPRMLPAGSPLEIRLQVTASRLLNAEVYVPVTDQSFKVAINLEPEQPPVAQLTRDVLGVQRRFDDSLPYLGAADAQVLARRLEETSELVRAASAGDPDALQKSVAALKEIQGRLDEVEDSVQQEQALAESAEQGELALRIVNDLGTPEDRARCDDLMRRLEFARQRKDVDEVERVTSLLGGLQFEILARHDWFWQNWFERLAASERWKNPAEAQRLIREGRQAILRNDMTALRRTVRALLELTPDAERAAFQNVGIRR